VYVTQTNKFFNYDDFSTEKYKDKDKEKEKD